MLPDADHWEEIEFATHRADLVFEGSCQVSRWSCNECGKARCNVRLPIRRTKQWFRACEISMCGVSSEIVFRDIHHCVIICVHRGRESGLTESKSGSTCRQGARRGADFAVLPSCFPQPAMCPAGFSGVRH